MPAARLSKQVDPTSATEVGARLALTRRALGYTTTTMCRLMDSVSHGSAYSNYESGIRLISIKHALALWRTCHLTLPWIYQGQVQTLRRDIRAKILEQMLREGQHTTRKSR